MTIDRVQPYKGDLIKLDSRKLSNIALFLYFISNVIVAVFGFILNRISLADHKMWITFLIIYLPVLIIVAVFRSTRWVDFVLLLGGVCIAFSMTYALHPEYEYWFTREIYGVWTRVLRPDRALYAYLFIRLVSDPKEILRVLRKVGYVQFIYYLFFFMEFMIKGYWEDYNYAGRIVKFSYSLTFGYNMLFPVILFLYFGYRESKKKYYILGLIGIGTILGAGSRGPLLILAIFFMLLFLTNIKQFIKKKYIFIIIIISLFFLVLIVGYEQILNMIIVIFDRLGISSRTIVMVLNGSISDGNGRNSIWSAAVEMIKKGGPIGYGVYGDRPIISNFHYAGYSHNLFLEMLVSFGIIIGGIMIFSIILNSVRMLFFCKDKDWKGLFLIFFTHSCQLITSMSFWYVSSFWASIAIFISYRQWQKRRKVYGNKEMEERAK